MKVHSVSQEGTKVGLQCDIPEERLARYLHRRNNARAAGAGADPQFTYGACFVGVHRKGIEKRSDADFSEKKRRVPYVTALKVIARLFMKSLPFILPPSGGRTTVYRNCAHRPSLFACSLRISSLFALSF
eukprot:IDg15106t1